MRRHAGAHSDVRDYLEETTGTSVTYVATPAAFVRGQPGLASSGRDYVYLAPLAVSRGGERSCWLWLGVWSTVDRQARDEDASPLGSGPCRSLQTTNRWTSIRSPSIRVRPDLSRIPYATPVPPTQEFMVQVTRSQLQRLGRARTLTLVDRPDGGAARLWRGDDHAVAVLSHFAEEAGAPGWIPLRCRPMTEVRVMAVAGPAPGITWQRSLATAKELDMQF